MKCEVCQSETPPLYQHHSLPAWICHTCKALGRVIESVFSPDSVEPEMPAPDPQVTQIVDQEPTVNTESEHPVEQEAPATEADQTDVDTGKRKTKKLK